MAMNSQLMQVAIENTASSIGAGATQRLAKQLASEHSFAEQLQNAVRKGPERAAEQSSAEKPAVSRESERSAYHSEKTEPRLGKHVARESAPKRRPAEEANQTAQQDKPATGQDTKGIDLASLYSLMLPNLLPQQTKPIVVAGGDLNGAAATSDTGTVPVPANPAGKSPAENQATTGNETVNPAAEAIQTALLGGAGALPKAENVEHQASPFEPLKAHARTHDGQVSPQEADTQQHTLASGTNSADQPDQASATVAQVDQFAQNLFSGEARVKAAVGLAIAATDEGSKTEATSAAEPTLQDQFSQPTLAVSEPSGSAAGAAGDKSFADGGTAQHGARDNGEGQSSRVASGQSLSGLSSEMPRQLLASMLAGQPQAKTANVPDVAAQPARTDSAAAPERALSAWENFDSRMDRIVNSASLLQQAGRSEMRIDLHTEMLGAMQLRAVLDRGRLDASIGVETSEAHSVLNSQLPALHQVLADRNVEVQQVTVVASSASGLMGQGTESGGSGSQDGSFAQSHPNTPRWLAGQPAAVSLNSETETASTEDQRRRLNVRA